MMLSFSNQNEQAIDFSWRAIFKVALAVAIVYLLYLIRDVFVLIIFSLVLSLLFNPAIDFLQKLKFSRLGATFLVYFFIIVLLGLIIYWVLPSFINEIQELSRPFPVYFGKVAPFLSGLGFDIFQSIDTFVAAIQKWLVGALSNIASSLASLLGSLISAISVFTLAFFFSLEKQTVDKFIRLVTPKKHEEYILQLLNKSQVKISGWVAIRAAGMFMIGFLTFLSCRLCGINYPVLLGFIAGVLDIIPFVGPIAAGFLLALLALIDSWQKALLIVIIYTIIQQLESNIIIPLLTRKFMDLPAIVVLVSIFIGERLWGLAGVILAIPLFGVLYDIANSYLEQHKD